jgi:thiol-disulfide isomerase/thioredoxin
LVFFLIFQGLSLLRETDMLASGTSISAQQTTLTSLNNKVVNLHSFEKTTVLYFFAPWCQICHASISNLQAVYQKNPDIDVIAIALDFVDQAQIKAFVNRHQLSFPVVLGNENIKKQFKVKGYPSYYIINEQNTVISKSMGYSSEIGLLLRTL